MASYHGIAEGLYLQDGKVKRVADLEAERDALVAALRRCADKLKAEYDRQQPDAAPDECWAEAEAAFDLLAAHGD